MEMLQKWKKKLILKIYNVLNGIAILQVKCIFG